MIRNPNLSRFVRIASPIPAQMPFEPPSGRNPFLRCPLPQAMTTASDYLAQYYQSGVPQYRIIPPLSRGTRTSLT